MAQIVDAAQSVVDKVSELAIGNDQKDGKADGPKKASKPAESSEALPQHILDRNALFDDLFNQYKAELPHKERKELQLQVNLGVDMSGKPRPVMNAVGKAWETTPGSFLREVDKNVAARIVIAKINNEELWDLDRPLESDCSISFVPFDDPEGRFVFWHSSAHALGEAAECQYECLLSHGPPVEQGFFYDMAIKDGQTVKTEDYKPLETRAAKIFKEKQSFDRLFVSKENLKKMFGYSKYKMHYIDQLLPEEGSTVYRCGTLVDLCRGPHIQNTGKIKTFQVMKHSSCYFLGDNTNDSLQRIYGVAFPDKQGMADWKLFLEEAAKRDHRKIGVEQELFFFEEIAAGSAFLLPHGVIIFNAIQKMIREQYWQRGYQEVQSPNMYNVDLWKQSGHWQHYKDDMFVLNVEKKEWGLKPMNCPGHCVIFNHRERSYRELPIRMADFGVLHRNEASGALNGLSRVRKFQQDDCHIFCTYDQITDEIMGLFDFLKHVYSLFGMAFTLKFSTRPEKYLGDIETWDMAEARLKESLDKFSDESGVKWELNPGDGAFYGPKIDVIATDALKRQWQCATIQLDFQNPLNFDLQYMTGESMPKAEPKPKGEKPNTIAAAEAGKEVAPADVAAARKKEPGPGRARPVMIHRAIVGSFERFMSVLTEHFAGKWPFWLSPRQVMVIPVAPAVNDYVIEVHRLLRAQKINADLDISGNTMPKKIRAAQLAQYNFIFVLGKEERDSRSVNIRNRDDTATQNKGELIPLDEALRKLKALRKERRLLNQL